MEVTNKHSRISRRKSTQVATQICAKDERNASIKKIAAILQKPDNIRSDDELELLLSYADIVKEVKRRLQKRSIVKQRLLEIEEPKDELRLKCKMLAQSIRDSKHLVIYTGAGISTAARIPDYRGTNGIWTRLQQGKDIGTHDLSLADPTYTHMALSTLYHRGILKYVVSQNCDGLHLRSGLPRNVLSELHGNMAIEVCKHCKPSREYWRLFDVTENTARYSHKTMRKCYECNNALVDTIVHFGERGTLQWPLNWSGACKNADQADTIICLGSSLKVLKKYPWLWQMDKPVKKRSNLFIVNLQWTPKDDQATLKINGKCDAVMKLVMEELGIDVLDYRRETDPIFVHATSITESEDHTTSQPELKREMKEEKIEVKIEDVVKELKREDKIEIMKESVVKELKQEEKIEIKKDDDIKPEIEEIKLEIEEIKTDIGVCDDDVIDLTDSDIEIDIKRSPIKDSIYAMDNLLADSKSKRQLNMERFAPPSSSNSQNFFPLIPIDSFNTLVSCYSSLGQNPLALLNASWYPYQTSFLYSGLHSIINPMPFFNYDFHDSKNLQEPETIVPEKQVPTCDFCFDSYQSYSCLFYKKYEPIFIKPVQRYCKSSQVSKDVYCECCDYTSESEAEDTDTLKKTKLAEEDSIDTQDGYNIENSNDILVTSNVKVQPGWFGKGYRKKRTRKR